MPDCDCHRFAVALKQIHGAGSPYACEGAGGELLFREADGAGMHATARWAMKAIASDRPVDEAEDVPSSKRDMCTPRLTVGFVGRVICARGCHQEAGRERRELRLHSGLAGFCLASYCELSSATGRFCMDEKPKAAKTMPTLSPSCRAQRRAVRRFADP
jgi:hypothetical protein